MTLIVTAMKARFQTPQIPMMSMVTMTFMPMWPPFCQSQTGIYGWFKGIYTAADALYTSLERPPPWPDPLSLTFNCAGKKGGLTAMFSKEDTTPHAKAALVTCIKDGRITRISRTPVLSLHFLTSLP